MDREHTGKAVTRRRFLQSGTLLAGSTLLGTAAGRTADWTVMTRNLYIGTGLDSVLELQTVGDFKETIDELYRNVQGTQFSVRAEAIADEIETTAPDIVGLQEVARFEKTDVAEPVTDDYLQILQGELADRGLSYTVGAEVTTFGWTFPASDGSTSYELTITNRDVILVREGVTVTDRESNNYLDPLDKVSLGRGYTAVTVADSFTFVNTHLATAATPRAQLVQGGELLARFHKSPAVMVGDFNSDPTRGKTKTYGTITDKGFTDSYAAVNPEAAGPTCCQRADLRNEESLLDNRVDYVFSSGEFETLDSRRVGHRPKDRIEGLWPSDHAGVVAELRRP
jgi:endonuclease/exonuclease/phosphatase family metal-dependent hydrolase